MKCEKCGNNEANFHYRASIDGEVTERHLCSECAAEEGLSEASNWRPSQFGGIFGPRQDQQMNAMTSAFMRMMTPRFFIPAYAMPVFQAGDETGAETAQEAELNLPEDFSEQLKSRREIIALRHQMQEAVQNEDFEKAAELRDRIKALEASAEK